MKLSYQFGISLFIVLLLVFCGSFWLNMNVTRQYVNAQLATHAQDTATSLGLSIAPYLSADDNLSQTDLAQIETMVNVIFDAGYYQSIVLKDNQGRILIFKSTASNLSPVPDWFSRLFTVTAPARSSTITSGWQMSGEIKIKANPALAKQKLWMYARQSAWMFSGVFLLSLLALLWIVRTITRPLSAVVSQIQAISEQEYGQISLQPRSTEIANIVLAVNRLSNSLSSLFTLLTQQADKFRRLAYEDPTTGCANRLAFSNTLQSILAEGGRPVFGYLMLIRFSQLTKINQSQGLEQGDAYVKSAAAAIHEVVQESPFNSELYRLNGSDFALLLPSLSQTHCEQLASSLRARFDTLRANQDSPKDGTLGIAAITTNESLTRLLERADTALISASHSASGYCFAEELGITHSQSHWRVLLNHLIHRGQVELLRQKITRTHDGKVEYSECFGRFREHASDVSLPMAQILAVARQLGRSSEVDKLILEAVAARSATTKGLTGVNLSPASVISSEFLRWLELFLQQRFVTPIPLVFEIEERALLEHRQNCIDLVRLIRRYGGKITLEHFGDNLATLPGLRDLKPDYVKLSGRYTQNVHSNRDSQLFIGSLLSIARGLGIQVIAEMVETETQRDFFVEAGIDLLQGYFLDAPHPWT